MSLKASVTRARLPNDRVQPKLTYYICSWNCNHHPTQPRTIQGCYDTFPLTNRFLLTMPETTPLLSNADGANYYFLNNGVDGKPSSLRGAEGGATVNGIPQGANAAEFEPKKLGPKRQVNKFRIPYRNIMNFHVNQESYPNDAFVNFMMKLQTDSFCSFHRTTTITTTTTTSGWVNDEI